MRIRQVVADYWSDRLLQVELTAAEREFYVGLWMLADDAGWLRLNIPEIAAELGRYQPVAEREAFAEACIAKLARLGRIEIHDCGHALIPTFGRHQRLAGATKRVYTIRDEHQSCSLRRERPAPEVIPAGPRGSPRAPARNGTGTVTGIGKGTGQTPPLTEEQKLSEYLNDRWGYEVSPAQGEMLAEIADRYDEGARGFRRVREVLARVDVADPIAFLKATERDMRERGRRTADAQEAASAAMRADNGRRLSSPPVRIGEILTGRES